MGRSEYARIKLSNIPQEFIDEYDLTTHACDGWVYFEIIIGFYELPQAEKLANVRLHVRLNKAGYYEAATTLGI